MKDYGKIKADGQIMLMPNPVRISFANATEEQKRKIAELDNWLAVQYTDAPDYNKETQYLASHFVEQNGKAVQVWEIHELDPQTDSAEE